MTNKTFVVSVLLDTQFELRAEDLDEAVKIAQIVVGLNQNHKGWHPETEVVEVSVAPKVVD